MSDCAGCDGGGWIVRPCTSCNSDASRAQAGPDALSVEEAIDLIERDPGACRYFMQLVEAAKKRWPAPATTASTAHAVHRSTVKRVAGGPQKTGPPNTVQRARDELGRLK